MASLVDGGRGGIVRAADDQGNVGPIDLGGRCRGPNGRIGREVGLGYPDDLVGSGAVTAAAGVPGGSVGVNHLAGLWAPFRRGPTNDSPDEDSLAILEHHIVFVDFRYTDSNHVPRHGNVQRLRIRVLRPADQPVSGG